MKGAGLVAVVLFAGACADEAPAPPPPGPAVAFPADYAATYTPARECRKSGDHELDFVRVLTDPAATTPYADRSTPFPDGAVVLKEQYDVSDTDCAGPVVAWTVMVKHVAATDRLGWDWQRVGADRRVLETNGSRCIGCHSGCTGAPAVGYDFTCEEP
jgi:hypothetical protein